MQDLKQVLLNPDNARSIAQFSIEYVLSFMLKGRDILGNDFDAASILFVIQVYVGERAFRLNTKGIRKLRWDEAWPDDLLVPISRLAIANITGLPKETVRRKVQKLEKMGLVRRVGSRGLAISHEFASSAGRADLMMHNHKNLFKLLGRLSDL